MNTTSDAQCSGSVFCTTCAAAGKQLVLTDVTYKLLAFMLLTPVVSVLFHVLVARRAGPSWRTRTFCSSRWSPWVGRA